LCTRLVLVTWGFDVNRCNFAAIQVHAHADDGGVLDIGSHV